MKKTKKLILVLLFSYLVSLLHIPSVSSQACGYISNVPVDEWDVGMDYHGWGKMLRLGTSEYYLTASIRTASEWQLRTVPIYNNNGTIGDVIDEVIYDSACYFMGGDFCHFKDDIYISVGTNWGNTVRVMSWLIWESNGTIDIVIDHQDLTKSMEIYIDATHAYNFESASMVVLDNGVIVVAFTDRTESNQLYLISLIVDDNGELSTETDLITINGTGWYPQVIALDSDTIAVMYSDSDDNGWIKTYDVDSDGDIGDADDHYEDIWEFEPTHCGDYSFDIKNVYGDKYLLAFNNATVGSHLVMKTVRIYDNGVIIKSFIDDMLICDGAGSLPTIFRVNEDIMGVAYRGPASDGFIRTFNITYLGYFDDLIIDTWEYWEDITVMNYPSVVYVDSDYLALFCEKYYINDLYKKLRLVTFEIECATGDIGGIGKLYVNVYDEANMDPIDFNISFFASDWGDSYSEIYCNTSCPCSGKSCCEDCSDSWNISFDQLPQGTDCYMIVGNGSYHDRYFMMDIYDEFISFEGDTYYTLCLNVFLAPESARLYNLKVIDDFYNPVDDVEIRIKRYIDPSIGTIDISTVNTDSYGMAQVFLIANYPYIFNCSKEDYYPVNFVWIPPDANNITKTIKMSYMYEEGPDIENISMDSMVLSAYNNSTMQIDYLNLNNDNDYVDFTVYDFFNDSSVLTTYQVTEYPNNITLLFTWTDYDLVGDLLKVTAVATRINGSTYTLTRYFNIQQGTRIGAGTAPIAAILSVGLCLFGLTLAHPKNVFGPIGLIVLIIALAITAFANQTWYIHLIQAVEFILLMVVLMIFREEGVHAV